MREILFQNGKKPYGDFSDFATGLWGGLFEPYAMLRVVSAFQIGQNVHKSIILSRQQSLNAYRRTCSTPVLPGTGPLLRRPKTFLFISPYFPQILSRKSSRYTTWELPARILQLQFVQLYQTYCCEPFLIMVCTW